MAGDYIKCPRCELNYIHKSEKYCDVCKAELKLGPELVFAVDEDEDEEPLELCPICKKNYIKEDQEMCDSCRQEMEYKNSEIDIDNDEEWKNYLDDDVDAPEEDSEEMLSLSKLAEDEVDELFDDEEEEEEEKDDKNKEKDDFEIPEIDEKDFLEEDEEEEEKEDDEEEDF